MKYSPSAYPTHSWCLALEYPNKGTAKNQSPTETRACLANTGTNICLVLFPESRESLIHSKMVKIHHEGDAGLWQCTDCSHTSSQAAGMRNHVESHHVGGGGYSCTHCNKFCKTKNAYDTHRSRYKHF